MGTHPIFESDFDCLTVCINRMTDVAMADNPGAPPAAEKPPPPEYPPNQTIYVNNISEKIKITNLVTELKAIFNQFGNIIEIQAKKNLRMRGQAFIVFEDIESAQKAVSSMQGFPFHDKKMRIAFAKSDSDVVSKAKGTYIPRDQIKKKKKKKKEKKGAANMAQMMQMMNPQMMMQMQKMMQASGMNMANMQNMAQMMPTMQANMQKMMSQMQETMKSATQKAPNMGLPEGKFGVNNIIFVQDLPQEVDEKMLSGLFEQFNGFVEVRMAPLREGTGKAAFIEYETESTAGHAKDTLQGFKITPQCQLKITFAKK